MFTLISLTNTSASQEFEVRNWGYYLMVSNALKARHLWGNKTRRWHNQILNKAKAHEWVVAHYGKHMGEMSYMKHQQRLLTTHKNKNSCWDHKSCNSLKKCGRCTLPNPKVLPSLWENMQWNAGQRHPWDLPQGNEAGRDMAQQTEVVKANNPDYVGTREVKA